MKANLLNSLCLLVLLAGLTSFAADKPKAPPETTPKGGYDLVIAQGAVKTHDGSMPATLGNVVENLRERYTEANIILAPGLAELTVADLKLRGGRLSDELEALRVASGEKFIWLNQSQSGGGARMITVDPTSGMPIHSPEDNRGLFTLREAEPTPENRRAVEVFNISGFLNHVLTVQDPQNGNKPKELPEKSLEELEKIILTTLDQLQGSRGSSGKSETPNFQFHAGANLLVVIGSSEALDVARRVITALPGQADSMPADIQNRGVPSQRTSSEDAFRRRYGLSSPGGPQPSPGQKP